jgi:hypothetical protein
MKLVSQPIVNTQSAVAQALVTSCLRYSLGTGDLPDLERLAASPGFEPEAVVAYSHQQRVAPLLYALHSAVHFPDALAQGLRQSYTATGQANLYLLHAFGQVLQALASQGMPVVVAKGVALIERIYHNPALRPLSDLDVFVKRGEARPAMDCLLGLGFEPMAEPYPGQALEFEKELMFTKPGTPAIRVDLHWSLIGTTFHLDYVGQDWTWELTEPIQVAGAPARCWCTELQILHLASHLWLNHEDRPDLIWWYDLAALIQKNQAAIHWELLLEFSQRLQVILPVRACLRALNTDWGVAIPGAVLEKLEALEPGREEKRLAAARQPGRSNAHRAWETLVMMKGLSRRLRYILMRLFPTPAYLRFIFPGTQPTCWRYLAYWLRGFQMLAVLLVKHKRK